MPLPLMPIVMGVGAVVAGAAGGGLAVAGYANVNAANNVIKRANARLESEQQRVEEMRKWAQEGVICELGKARLEAQENFKRFLDAFEKIKNRPELREVGKEDFNFTKVDFDKVREASLSATEIIGGAGGAGVAGAAAVGGAYFLVGLFGSASTGAAINGLAGAAATNAILAWFGGGSLAAGGLGMAGGAAILGGLAAAPAALIVGFFLYYNGEKAAEKANEAEKNADEAIEKMYKLESFIKSISGLANALLGELRKAQGYYDYEVGQLEELVNRCDDYNQFSEEDKILLDNNIMIVKILMDMARVDLLKKDVEDNPVMEEDAIRQDDVRNLIAKSAASLKEIAA